jgi:hypothetical protein
MFRFRTGPLLNQTEDCRNEENTNDTRCQHASNDGCAHDLPGHGTGTGSDPKRERNQNEGERNN